MDELNIVIREAREDDLPAMLALYAQPDMDGEALAVDEARRAFRDIASGPNHQFFVATNEERVIGTFAVLVVPMLSRSGSKMGVLEDVVVLSGLQGKGIGRRMMEFANARCRKLGCYKIMLSSALHRERTHKFYEALGYRKHGYSFYLDLPSQNAED